MARPITKTSALCRIAAQITSTALVAGSRQLAALSAYSKPGIETGGEEVVTSADVAASDCARTMARSLLGGFVYIDEEMASDPDEAAAVARTHPLVAMGDPIDGSLAIAKTGVRLSFFGKCATPGDTVDQYSSTLTLWKAGAPIVSAVATARGHVLVSDGVHIQHARFSFSVGRALPRLHTLPVPRPSLKAHLGKHVAFLGAIEHLPPAALNAVRKKYHCQRPGHFASDFIELLCGNARLILSGTEKIWDYSVAVPFVSAIPSLSMTDLAGNPIRAPYPSRTSLRIAWKSSGFTPR